MLPAGARGKERDSTPLNTNSSNRTSSQNQSSRRGEVKDSQKKRPAEPGDDWRRSEIILLFFLFFFFWLNFLCTVDDAQRSNGDGEIHPWQVLSFDIK
jgi:Flp pilus assembly protein TadB